MITAVDVIRTKRDREPLTDEQVDWIVAGFTRGDVADEQMAALAMAILLNGMTARETARWTAAMIASGERLALPDVGRPLVDKHSTGGVKRQDHAPARAARRRVRCGGAAALRARPGTHRRHAGQAGVDSGWRRSSARRDRRAAGVGRRRYLPTTPTLAPADRKLYALRDVTGTVESIPLIASSIMSKKIAEGTDGWSPRRQVRVRGVR